jgi:hypothetical protein
MKWALVVLIGGISPVATDVTFEKLSDCLAATEQLRQTYADAYDAFSQQAGALQPYDRHRRHDFRERESESRKFANTGTCVPHAGTDQAFTSLNGSGQPASPPRPAAPAQPPAKE